MMLLGPQINYMPSKSHVTVLLYGCSLALYIDNNGNKETSTFGVTIVYVRPCSVTFSVTSGHK